MSTKNSVHVHAHGLQVGSRFLPIALRGKQLYHLPAARSFIRSWQRKCRQLPPIASGHMHKRRNPSASWRQEYQTSQQYQLEAQCGVVDNGGSTASKAQVQHLIAEAWRVHILASLPCSRLTVWECWTKLVTPTSAWLKYAQGKHSGPTKMLVRSVAEHSSSPARLVHCNWPWKPQLNEPSVHLLKRAPPVTYCSTCHLRNHSMSVTVHSGILGIHTSFLLPVSVPWVARTSDFSLSVAMCR